MEFRLAYRRFLPGLFTIGFIMAAAGCQSGDAGGVLGPAAAKDDLKPPTEKVKESDLIGFCPRVALRDGTAFFNSYAKGGQDDPAKLLYQTALTDVTRACTRSDGQLTIVVSVAGKVVPGPAGAPGNLTLPIRIAAIQGTTVVYSELKKYQVAVTDTSAATQFVYGDTKITIPEPTKRDVMIFAGFDEGPAKPDKGKKTAAADAE